MGTSVSPFISELLFIGYNSSNFQLNYTTICLPKRNCTIVFYKECIIWCITWVNASGKKWRIRCFSNYPLFEFVQY